MPIPLVVDPHARRIARELRRCAAAVGKLARENAKEEGFVDLKAIADRFASCAATLEKGVASGRVTKAQFRSMAGNLEAVATLLRQ